VGASKDRDSAIGQVVRAVWRVVRTDAVEQVS